MNFGLNESWKPNNNLSSVRLFFTAFLDVGTLGEEKISSITEESYSAMTSNGDVNLDYHIYKLSFLNFLIGKQPNGPGQYIFGSVVPKVSWNLLNPLLTSLVLNYLQVAFKFSPEGFSTFPSSKLPKIVPFKDPFESIFKLSFPKTFCSPPWR